MTLENDDFNLAMGMQKSLESLPDLFNLDEFEQLTCKHRHTKDGGSGADNYEKTSLDILANAAVQLELGDK